MRHWALLAALGWGALAGADGGFIPLAGRAAGTGEVSSAAQKAVIIRDGAHEILLLQTTYSGPAERFAWVVPVPTRPAPGDIFLASADFLKGAFLTTQPTGHTILEDPWPPLLPVAGSGRPGYAPVTVWREELVGDYEATVLSAAGGGALTEWLRRHGYAVPEALGPVADEYTRAGWSFVALKMNPERVPGGRLLREVQPLGLRFRANRLVFPLRISTVSAPARTSLLLVVYAPDTVLPRELPVVGLPAECRLLRGHGYPEAARQVVGERQGRALLLEQRQPGPQGDGPSEVTLRRLHLTSHIRTGHYRADPAAAPVRDWAQLGYTRLWGLLPREVMTDLSFAAGPRVSTSTIVSQHGWMRYPAWARALAAGWPQLLVMLLVGAVVYWRRQASGTADDDEAATAASFRGRLSLVAVAVVAAVLVLMVARPVLFVLVILCGWQLWAPIAVWYLVAAVTQYRHDHRFWTAWCTLTVVVALSLPNALARGWGREALAPRVTGQLSQALTALDGALREFVDRHNCYPAALGDLTSPQPTHGQDASGNPVAITTRGPGQPTLERLPVDPLTGRRDTWVYDVLAPGMVDSGGYQVGVRYVESVPH